MKIVNLESTEDGRENSLFSSIHQKKVGLYTIALDRSSRISVDATGLN